MTRTVCVSLVRGGRKVVSAKPRDEDAGAYQRDAEHGERDLIGTRLVKTETHQHWPQPGPHGEDREQTSVDLAIGAQPEVTADHESDHVHFGAETEAEGDCREDQRRTTKAGSENTDAGQRQQEEHG